MQQRNKPSRGRLGFWESGGRVGSRSARRENKLPRAALSPLGSHLCREAQRRRPAYAPSHSLINVSVARRQWQQRAEEARSCRCGSNHVQWHAAPRVAGKHSGEHRQPGAKPGLAPQTLCCLPRCPAQSRVLPRPFKLQSRDLARKAKHAAHHRPRPAARRTACPARGFPIVLAQSAVGVHCEPNIRSRRRRLGPQQVTGEQGSFSPVRRAARTFSAGRRGGCFCHATLAARHWGLEGQF